MNKSNLIEAISEECDLSKATSQRALEVVISKITTALTEGEDVTIVGFGTFSVVDRAARIGRNPQTNVQMTIPATRVVKFRAGKSLKAAVE